MKLNLEFNDVAKSGVKKIFVRRILRATLASCGFDLSRKIVSVSFAVVSKEEIRQLNKKYRHVNSATDVLSFAEYVNSKEMASAGDKLFLGEIVLCYNYLEEFVRNKRLDLKQETARAVAHACLHLLGFNHGERMFRLQNAAASNI